MSPIVVATVATALRRMVTWTVLPAATLFALNATSETVEPAGAIGELDPHPVVGSNAAARASTKISDGCGVVNIHGQYVERRLLVCSIVSNQPNSRAIATVIGRRREQ
jgi:hypothetical protein